MKRYLASYGDQYYAAGGLADPHAFFSDQEEAIIWAMERRLDDGLNRWCHVWDLTEDRAIFASGSSYGGPGAPFADAPDRAEPVITREGRNLTAELEALFERERKRIEASALKITFGEKVGSGATVEQAPGVRIDGNLFIPSDAHVFGVCGTTSR